MHYAIESDIQFFNQSKVIVIGIFDDSEQNPVYVAYNERHPETMQKLRQRIIKKNQLISHLGENDQYILLINQGKSTEFNATQLFKYVQTICNHLNQNNLENISVALQFPDSVEKEDQIRQCIHTFDQVLYQFNHFKSEAQNHPLKQISFYGTSEKKKLLEEITALNNGVRMTRDLANTPANICTPSYLAATAQELSQQHSRLSCKILGPQEMASHNMGALLAVAAGSEQEPRLIELQYRNAGNKKPIILVGKGITFDSGGLCIKPGVGMQEMKFDMCGAAAVMGVIKACAEMKLKVNLIGIIASAENMISGKAVKPGDVITTMSGQSVEIINTDAEGRLVLADALTYAKQFNPEFVIDIATLTGAMVVALGDINTGFMTSDNDLADLIMEAAKRSHDRCWRMPLDDDYQKAIDSDVADMLNAAFDRSAGSITAACFLSRYTKSYRWAHLDIAGTAWQSGKTSTASGRPVPMLVELIRKHVHAH